MTAQRPAIVITRRLAPGIVEVLAGCCEVRQHDSERPMSRAALIDAAPGSAALLTTLADVVDSKLLDAAGPGLRIVASHAVGFHNIDVPACTARGVIVTNTPDVLTDATADLAWALLLTAARRVGQGEGWIRAGNRGCGRRRFCSAVDCAARHSGSSASAASAGQSLTAASASA